MPFQYRPIVSPYVGAISDVLGRQAEVRGQATLTAGEARARGQERAGDIRGESLRSIGANLASGIEAYATEQRAAPLRAAQLAAAQRPALLTAAFKRIREGATNPDGSLDIEKARRQAQIHLGDFPEVLMRFNTELREQEEASQPTFGSPETYLVDGEQVLVRERVGPRGDRSWVDMQGDPIIGSIRSMAGKQILVRRTNQDGQKVPTWIPEGTARGDDELIPPPAAERSPSPSQESTFRLMNPDGTFQDVKGDYIPGVGGEPGRYFFQGEDVTGRAKRIPPGTAVGTAGAVEGPAGFLRGESFLETLSPDQAELVRAIADYKVDIAKVASLRTGQGGVSARQQMAQWVLQFDPSWDQTMYPARSRTRLDFSAGKAANNIRSLNTAVHHVVTLFEKIRNLENAAEGDWLIFTQLFNTAKNKFYTATGDPRITEFGLAANAVESELASLFKGTGATDQEIKAWREQLHSSQSVDQLEGAITTALGLLQGRLSALDQQWVANMNTPRDFRILSDSSRRELELMDIDVEAFDPVAPPPTADEDDAWLDALLGGGGE
jgi:hypothetical protein